uniref:Uncharacterized protein n=1 Tax=Rhodosorus marinus TaxID=101924 RepID=A0A7S2ZL73_9RHOD|mmetsp:Transcript_23787/g.93577  ORF Transcript_23787/g.93577 Transcript_23787/m.93577 type:complete len:164 (+) Transcript_23787:200-691(+)
MSLREPRGRLLRRILDIQEYDFHTEHRSGVSPIMAMADALSRAYDLEGDDAHGESVAVVVDEDPGWDLHDNAEIQTEQVRDLGEMEKFVDDEDDQYAISEEGLIFKMVNEGPLNLKASVALSCASAIEPHQLRLRWHLTQESSQPSPKKSPVYTDLKTLYENP